MADNQLKYSTEITHEHYGKYRNLSNSTIKELGLRKIAPRNLLYPNDKHMITKTLDGAIYGSIFGFTSGFVMANYATGFQGPLSNMSVIFFKHATPWVLAGAVYGLGTSASANYRHSEDYVNHMVGGAMGGAAFGLWYKQARMTFWSSVLVSLAAGGLKYLKDCGDETKGEFRKAVVYNQYRKTWFTEPIPVSESDDYKYYKP